MLAARTITYEMAERSRAISCGDDPIPEPTHIGDGRFFLTGSYGAKGAMLKVQRKDGQRVVSPIFDGNVCRSFGHRPLLYKEHLYLNVHDGGLGLTQGPAASTTMGDEKRG